MKDDILPFFCHVAMAAASGGAGAAGGPAAAAAATVSIQELLIASDKRELGADAVLSLSSAKPGNGVEQLRDGSLDTYWQSDGVAPHTLNVAFVRRVSVSQVCLYVDFNLDESYTPKKIAVKSGTSLHDLIDVTAVELHEPIGWVTIALSDPYGSNGPLRTHLIQLRVVSMHQNGRDTHIRQLKVFGPRADTLVMGNTPLDSFHSTEMQQYAVLR